MIVATYAGLLALVYAFLSLNVILGRYKYRVALGDAGNFDIKRRMRAHANFIEYTPLFLLLITYAEMEGYSHFWVNALCGAFLLGRVVHGLSLTKIEKYDGETILEYPRWRSLGMACTFGPILTVSFYLIAHSL